MSIGTLTMAMLVLGMLPQFEKLADPSEDLIGRSLDMDELPDGHGF